MSGSPVALSDVRDLFLLSLVCVLSGCGVARLEPAPCVFPESPAKSVIGSGLPHPSDGTFRGWVVDVQMQPIQNAVVRLEPGNHLAGTDSMGQFEVDGIPRGRYLMEVSRIPYASASDSVTFSEFGVNVIAVLAIHPGDLECTRI